MIDIATTRNSAGDMKTTTSGPALAGGGLNELFATLIRQKMAQQAVPAPSMRMPSAAFAPEPQRPEPQRPDYVPTMGSAPMRAPTAMPAPVTRMRRVRTRTSLPSMIDAKGLTYDEVPETQLADGSWSLDAVHGTLAGNEAAARQRMDALDSPYGGGGHGGGGGEDRPRRPVAPIDPRNRNNDARGPGFGMDYGR